MSALSSNRHRQPSAPTQTVCNTPLIDVRPEADFLLAHDPAAANIPLEQLPQRVHELPSRGRGVRVIDSDATRAAAAAAFFQGRGTAVRIETFTPDRQSESGPSPIRLWDPSPFLPEALHKIASERNLTTLSALDVACGTGRDAVYMALRGLRVTAIDLLPDALSRVQDLARRNNVNITTLCHDLEKDATLPSQITTDVLTVFRYLHRPLFPALIAALHPGGYAIYETFHEQTRATGNKPSNPAHLLRPAELPQLFPNFEILIFRDAHERDGRFFSSLLARKPNVR